MFYFLTFLKAHYTIEILAFSSLKNCCFFLYLDMHPENMRVCFIHNLYLVSLVLFAIGIINVVKWYFVRKSNFFVYILLPLLHITACLALLLFSSNMHFIYFLNIIKHMFNISKRLKILWISEADTNHCKKTDLSPVHRWQKIKQLLTFLWWLCLFHSSLSSGGGGQCRLSFFLIN
jgi:hypothetical protein